MSGTVYCFDTSAWVHAWVRAYPAASFPGLWVELERLVVSGRLVSPDEVREELERKDDELLAWLQERPQVFQPVDEAQQRAIMGLLADFPQLVDSSKGRNEADPWVVVVAELAGATVVTEEGSRPRNPRIPDICRRRATSFCRLLDVIVAEGWRFHSDLG